jgi:hypothetical protein
LIEGGVASIIPKKTKDIPALLVRALSLVPGRAEKPTDRKALSVATTLQWLSAGSPLLALLPVPKVAVICPPKCISFGPDRTPPTAQG